MRVRPERIARLLPDEAPLDDRRSIVVVAGKRFLEDNCTMLASALAYSTFFAIPSVLLVVVGLFTLIAGPSTISSLMGQCNHVMPAQATSLLNESLQRLGRHLRRASRSQSSVSSSPCGRRPAR